MSFSEDRCDYCDVYVDPIGGDTARMVGKKYWCGQCDVGIQHIFGHIRSDGVKKIITHYERDLEHDPIHPHLQDPDREPDTLAVHVEKLRKSDTISQLKRLLELRGE